MELVKEIESKRNNKGKLIKYGEFLCPFDNKIVERKLSDGKRDKSCGCVRYKLSKDRAEKLRLIRVGKKNTEEARHKMSEANKGKIVSEETRQKISEANRGKKRTESFKHKASKNSKGRKHTVETRMKISLANTGELNPNWNNGSSFEIYPKEFKQIKRYILERDNYKCQDLNCEHKIDTLDCHHIDYNKQNNSLDNLITLCRKCHAKTFGKKKRVFWTEYYQNIIINRIVECLL